jgi:protein-S-isoprenylcysteine O-methyltransferase Ste14
MSTPGARFEAAVFGQRNVLAAVPVVLAWLGMSPPVRGSNLFLATLLVAAGAALRAWSTLYNRYAQGERKSLATGGPYSWMRNPLYVANSLVLIGGFVASGLWAWLPVALVWFGLVYTFTIRHEERRLHEKYAGDYAAYCARVGRWLPRRIGEWPRVPPGAFATALAVQSRSLLILAPFLLRNAL